MWWCCLLRMLMLSLVVVCVTGGGAQVHKMARVDGFCVYWRIDDNTR